MKYFYKNKNTPWQIYDAFLEKFYVNEVFTNWFHTYNIKNIYFLKILQSKYYTISLVLVQGVLRLPFMIWCLISIMTDH